MITMVNIFILIALLFDKLFIFFLKPKGIKENIPTIIRMVERKLFKLIDCFDVNDNIFCDFLKKERVLLRRILNIIISVIKSFKEVINAIDEKVIFVDKEREKGFLVGVHDLDLN